MNFGFRRQLGLLIVPNLALVTAFVLAWWSPGTPGAATPAECRLIMLIEGLTIVVAALVGVYIEISLITFPLILAGCVAWWVHTGVAGISSTMICFVWYVVSAFIDGVSAHRGHFGPARENPAHPHRRYDRMLLLYLATVPLFLALRVTDHSSRWAIWGTIYFTSLAAVDTVLRDWFDRIPRGILRRLKAWARPETASQLGICADCVHVQPAIPPRPRRWIRCGLSATDPRMAEYPTTPVLACDGFRPTGSL